MTREAEALLDFWFGGDLDDPEHVGQRMATWALTGFWLWIQNVPCTGSGMSWISTAPSAGIDSLRCTTAKPFLNRLRVSIFALSWAGNEVTSIPAIPTNKKCFMSRL